MTIALYVAVFVKTPGLSPVKTRLAAGLGEETALAFYWQACGAVAATLAYASALADPPLVPHWAVAESAGLDRWPRFPALAQGEGGLGERMAHVVACLLTGARGAVSADDVAHGAEAAPDEDLQRAAVLIGADAPQLDHQAFAETHEALLDGADFVLGPAADGGFYLFATRRPVPLSVWTSVPYSDPTTAARLAAALAPHGRVAWLSTRLTDADRAEDLPAVLRELQALPNPAAPQWRLAAWLARLTASV